MSSLVYPVAPIKPALPDYVYPCVPFEPHPYYQCYHYSQFRFCPSHHQLGDKDALLSTTATRQARDTISPEEARDAALVEAISAGDVQRTKLLIASTVNQQLPVQPAITPHSINRQLITSGLAPLHHAAWRGHLDVVKYLVRETGALVDITDREGETPLLKAAMNGHAGVVQYLVDQGADVNHQDSDGWSALHNGASRARTSIVKLLLAAGAIVDAKSSTGHTPLMSAAAKGYADVVKILLTHRADPLLKNNFGDSAYDLAAQSEEAFICEILQEAEQDWIERMAPPSAVRMPLIPQHNVAVEIIHENQRCTFLTRQFSAQNLTKNDMRGPWSTVTGRPCGKESVLLPLVRSKDRQLVRGWFWLTDWKLDLRHPRVDPVEGWQYARNFEEPENHWGPSPPSTFMVNGCVRRRRWVRVRKRRLDLTVQEDKEDEPTVNRHINYISAANSLVQEAPTLVGEATHDIESIRSRLRHFQDAIQLLLTGIKSEKDVDHKRTASTLITQFLAAAEELDQRLLEQNLAGDTTSQLRDKGKEPATQADGVDTDSDSTSESAGNVGSEAVALSSKEGPELLSSNEWQPDDEAPDCTQCGRRFNLFLRRHHCRNCGKIFCGNCTSSKLTLWARNPPSRVCDACFAKLTKRRSRHTPVNISGFESDVAKMDVSDLESPISPTRHSLADSIMNECPVCQRTLDPDQMGQSEMEAHVAGCLNAISTGRGEGLVVSGNRYIAQVLKEDLISKECPICFEEFLEGQRIARLNCLCIYHENCIETWFSHPKYGARTCPVHAK
ncbi:hypothetical protein HDU85_003346 [Gaertneriomyces sp. JEL0708]|nr:hypothetical protein HDU85_003346 [Gaertneriomyces sp. JEL0708]